MGLGIRKNINKIFIMLSIFHFSINKFLYGFENANRLLRFIDKRAVIPILRSNGAVIGVGCDIESPLILHNCTDYKNLLIGNDCHLGKDTFLDLAAPIIIEDEVTISMRATIITHIDVGKSPLKEHGYPISKDKVTLKKGCYIGANALLLRGVTIGECALIAAGAVVLQDIPSYTIAAGMPAKIINKIN